MDRRARNPAHPADPPLTAPTAIQLIRAAGVDLALAMLVGALLSVPFGLGFADFPRTAQYTFYSAPGDHAALRRFYETQPAFRDVSVEPIEDGVRIRYVVRGQFTRKQPPPFQELGYAVRKVVDESGLLPRLGTRMFLIVLLCTQVGFLLIGYTRRRRMRIEGRAWPDRSLDAGHAAAPWSGLLVGALLFGFGWAYGLALEAIRPEDLADSDPWSELSNVPLGVRVGMVAVGVLLAPLAEEILFRGVVFARFARDGRAGAGAWVSAILFAAAHLDPWRFPAYVVYGLVLARLFARVRSLTPCVLAHALNNAAAFAVLLSAG